MPDLRRIGLHPDFWQPLASSGSVKKGKTKGVSFGGEPIVLARSEAGAVFALADRCAHRQVPLRLGMVCGESIKCGYHGWTFDKSGKCLSVPSLGKEQGLPNGVRSYPCREAYGLVFVFTGDAALASKAAFPDVPAYGDPEYKTRTLSRRIRCHYSFMHENLMDMNHQFLHRRLMGGIQPILLGRKRGPDWVEAVYRFSRVSGAQSLGEKFMVGEKADGASRDEPDVMVIRTQYPYQTLTFKKAGQAKPALDLWLSYVPVDPEQRVNHSFGLMSIKKPSFPGLIHLFWPFIAYFTDGIFAQDQVIVEEEQKAHDAQKGDRNQEIFPVINDLREVLAGNGVPLP
ncbi:MAG: aromatic ring-hydroxylating dioxygenase subunit alpha [Elusimicrobia bacterium]|nr:aromatic ring-hydroxylating dioxygenase subunit alpha [Elusimicrobiota bacterium]